MEKLIVLELFSGIGGMHFALKKSGLPGEIACAVDINPIANDVYSHNFPEVNLLNRNVQFINEKFIEKHEINTILMSPPCQPFTRVGNQKDIEDKRTDAFLHICDLIPTLKTVERILMENVKGFETSKARNMFVDALKEGGFNFQEFLLSPSSFGVPNSRTRYFCIARKGIEFQFDPNQIIDKIPYEESSISITVGDILEKDVALTSLPFLSEETLKKRNLVMDICTPESTSTTCFTKAYSRYIEGTGSLFTKYSKQQVEIAFGKREDSDEFIKALKELELRFFTPREVARLMSFPEEFTFPESVTNKQKYRLLGNSLNVVVVSELLKILASVS